MYREIFEQEGLQVLTATTAARAITVLEANGASLDVVLIDRKMPGGDGPDAALGLMAEVSRLAPFAKPIIATGYAPPSIVERAFRAGVYEYAVKNIAFGELLRSKVRNAIEATRAQRQLAMKEEEVVHELRSLWSHARSESDRYRKRGVFGALVHLLFRATPGFGRVTARFTNEIEAISMVIENRTGELPWKDESAYLLAECRNWSSMCGADELRAFRRKLTTKDRRVSTGMMIAPGGFSADANEDARAHKEGGLLVILIDDTDLERWITSDDRLAVLRSFHERAAFDLN
jgi:CheY-like chemotaxis protein